MFSLSCKFPLKENRELKRKLWLTIKNRKRFAIRFFGKVFYPTGYWYYNAVYKWPRPITFNQKQPPEVFYKKVLSKISQNLHENTYSRVSFFCRLRPAILLKKDTLAHVFSIEFCEIFKSAFLQKTPGWLLLFNWHSWLLKTHTV